jgi:23S rRNA G2445 N2-methylase RlmL
LNNSFSVTVSTYKNKKIDKKNLKTKIAEKITSKYLWGYTPLSHENFDIRIQIESNKVLIIIKIFSKSLFFREYRIQSQKGAIRPSIAGAMLYYLTRGGKD